MFCLDSVLVKLQQLQLVNSVATNSSVLSQSSSQCVNQRSDHNGHTLTRTRCHILCLLMLVSRYLSYRIRCLSNLDLDGHSSLNPAQFEEASAIAAAKNFKISGLHKTKSKDRIMTAQMMNNGDQMTMPFIHNKSVSYRSRLPVIFPWIIFHRLTLLERQKC